MSTESAGSRRELVANCVHTPTPTRSNSTVASRQRRRSGRGSSEKVEWWALVEGVWEGCLTPHQFGGPGCYPRNFFLKIYVQICNLAHFGGIRSSKVERKIVAFPSHFKKWNGIYRPAAPASAVCIGHYSLTTDCLIVDGGGGGGGRTFRADDSTTCCWNQPKSSSESVPHRRRKTWPRWASCPRGCRRR